MNFNVLPNVAYSMCMNIEFHDNERALEIEEKLFLKDIENKVFLPE